MNKKERKIKAWIVYWKRKDVFEFVIKPRKFEAEWEKREWKGFDVEAKIKRCEITFNP